jgi:hypothetical protein
MRKNRRRIKPVDEQKHPLRRLPNGEPHPWNSQPKADANISKKASVRRAKLNEDVEKFLAAGNQIQQL